MKNLKKLLILMCVLTCVFSFTACGNSKDEDDTLPLTGASTEDEFVSSVIDLCDTVGSWDKDSAKEQYEQYKDYTDEVSGYRASMIKAFIDAEKECGEYKGLYYNGDKVKYTLSTDDDEVTITLKAQFEKKDANITMVFKDIEYADSSTSYMVKTTCPISTSIESNTSMASKMKTAGLNTLMGISIVVIVLAFLSVFISLFKYINIIQQKFENRKKSKAEPASVDKTISQIVEKESENEADDEELVAVIAAAIAAAEHTSVDGFVVRSIKKVPNRRWK